MTKRVLVIEDDEMSAELVSRTIDRCEGYTCHLSANGKDGLDAIKASDQQFDLIVLDLSLPDVDGLEFIRLLSETTFQGRVVIASGHSKAVLNAAKQLADFHKITVLDTLQKPVSPKELRAVLERIPSTSSAEPAKVRARDSDITGSQLIPHYQPQVDANSGEVVGFEALLRLQLADGPIVGPDVLFSRVRSRQDRVSTSLVISRLVLKDVKKALEETTNFPGVSINFDARILEDNETMSSFAKMVKDSGVAPSLITIEVIEKSLPTSDAQLLEALTRLSMDGFRLSLDDYGAGGSNQDLLRRSPFDELKLDHNLIHSGLNDPVSQKFVSNAVETARGLDLDLVGEGVESADHLSFVLDQGIKIVQGFLFGRPMPIERMIDYLHAKNDLRNIA